MNEAERNGLSAMRDCWISGGAASGLAPAEWQEIANAAQSDERERLLLAIAGQAFDIGFRPAAPKGLTVRPPLPKLALPAVPEQHRSLFRSALKNAGSDARARLRVVAVAEVRGYVSHPLDWMPAASDLDAPRAYAPWVDWQQATAGQTQILEPLNAANWEEFYPAARRYALADLRRNEPAAARALLEAKVGAETAEVRYPLIELMRVNLSAADIPYLQSLSADRSGKVKELAARFLARVGQAQASGVDADAKELADFIEQGRAGFIRRRTTYAPKALKNYAQISRRQALYGTVQLADLARALGTTELELVEGWQHDDKQNGDYGFARMVCESGTDEAVARLRDDVIKIGEVSMLAQLLPRLDAPHRREFVKLVLSRGMVQGGAYVDEAEPGSFDTPSLMGSALYKVHRNSIATRDGGDRAAPDLTPFGYLATPQAAQAMLTDLTAAGLGPADPSLALLRLNAALSER